MLLTPRSTIAFKNLERFIEELATIPDATPDPVELPRGNSDAAVKYLLTCMQIRRLARLASECFPYSITCVVMVDGREIGHVESRRRHSKEERDYVNYPNAQGGGGERENTIPHVGPDSILTGCLKWGQGQCEAVTPLVRMHTSQHTHPPLSPHKPGHVGFSRLLYRCLNTSSYFTISPSWYQCTASTRSTDIDILKQVKLSSHSYNLVTS
ncbi:hypothetical protein EmuJ_000073800 [Echinococcus multilocularis]|uniref:Uncharacterized protein n=1 Tax=Echinococcus multilocularis TaxID=6211 RepID=A0A087VXG9_ECHMU|nr:hypothetical protein EmuJ_000073800 [Echinococcus multilocularis]